MRPNQIVIRRAELPAILGLSLPTIDRLRASGDFPPARRLGRQAVGFLKTEVEAWLANRPVAAQ